MFDSAQSPQEYFRLILLTVVGQAFGAAGYALDERPMQWAGGLFRFVNPTDAGQHVIEYQLLAYAEDMPSRFRVSLTRADGARRTLSALVVEDFDVPILPSADHWWQFRDVTELGRALAEAGHLAIGYALPWLSGGVLPSDLPTNY
ncbi:MAG: hypothetical protein IT319_16145 [Anaerolineae bacterium]|nr:hypothetical protein [Anaerolineae bacterium]